MRNALPRDHATWAPIRGSPLGRRCNFLPISGEDEEDDGEEGRKEGRGPPAVKHEVDPLRFPRRARLAATARDLTHLESRLTSERRCLGAATMKPRYNLI